MTVGGPHAALRMMLQRAKSERRESEVAGFFELLYCGEFLTKLAVSSLVSALPEDKERQRYRLQHRLVRAAGVGDWASALDEVLTGPASQILPAVLRDEQKQLVERFGPSSWQHEAVRTLRKCVVTLGHNADVVRETAAARQWFHIFATLRNKTRGHGAPKQADCAAICDPLELSIRLIAENFRLFNRPWAYLHRNLSGRYRVTAISDAAGAFDYLKSGNQEVVLVDGVYIDLDRPVRIELLESSVDCTDFFIANGDFRGGTFELLSYLSNQNRRADGSRYSDPIQPLPRSETEPLTALDVMGETFTNIPPMPRGYIERTYLEGSLMEQLLAERHPIVSLTGAGGIGKTSLALAVLHEIGHLLLDRFEMILWFSARDIDLLEEGPKRVMPHSLSLEDFAEKYVELVGGGNGPAGLPLEVLGRAMAETGLGPTLFVFDNFETVIGHKDVYHWIDTYVRLPNKVLITTRMRSFVGDYPIEVSGMTQPEAYSLMGSYSKSLGISELITPEYMEEVLEESGGHPYVIKILLGEVAKKGRLGKPERIVADREEILAALFERTYSALSSAAQRVFLLMCNWRSVLPEVAIEAVMLRPGNVSEDVGAALEELKASSLIEETEAETDGEVFLSVPLAAAIFGKRKLVASPLKVAVDADTELLRAFGAARKEDIRHGVHPRIKRLLVEVAKRATADPAALEEFRPMLEFIARRLPIVWLDLADLYEERGTGESLEGAKESLRRYLETPLDAARVDGVWARLGTLCNATGDYGGEMHALVEMCESAKVPLEVISNAASRINFLDFQLKERGQRVFDTEERRLLIGRVVRVLELHGEELSATDCSRLAWLHLKLGDVERARKVVVRGLELEPYNEHCAKIMAQITRAMPRPGP